MQTLVNWCALLLLLISVYADVVERFEVCDVVSVFLNILFQ